MIDYTISCQLQKALEKELDMVLLDQGYGNVSPEVKKSMMNGLMAGAYEDLKMTFETLISGADLEKQNELVFLDIWGSPSPLSSSFQVTVRPSVGNGIELYTGETDERLTPRMMGSNNELLEYEEALSRSYIIRPLRITGFTRPIFLRPAWGTWSIENFGKVTATYLLEADAMNQIGRGTTAGVVPLWIIVDGNGERIPQSEEYYDIYESALKALGELANLHEYIRS